MILTKSQRTEIDQKQLANAKDFLFYLILFQSQLTPAQKSLWDDEADPRHPWDGEEDITIHLKGTDQIVLDRMLG